METTFGRLPNGALFTFPGNVRVLRIWRGEIRRLLRVITGDTRFAHQLVDAKTTIPIPPGQHPGHPAFLWLA